MAEELRQTVQKVRDKIDQSLQGVAPPQLEDLAKRLNVRKADIVMGGGALLTFFVFFLARPSTVILFSNLVALCPVIDSLKAARSSSKADDQQWLLYWILFGMGTVVEALVFFFFGRDECRDSGGLTLYTTVYFGLKVAFYVWAAYGGGAAIVYERVVGPLFDKYFPEKGAASSRRD